MWGEFEIRKLVASISVYIFLGIFSGFFAIVIGTKYYTIDNTRLTQFTVAITSPSAIACCTACEVAGSCNSVSYKTSFKQCRLSAVKRKDLDANSEIINEWITYSINDPADWIPVFQGIADIGVDVYDSWVNGSHVTTTDCMTDNVQHCTKHFRSRFAEDWFTLGIKQVRISAYKDGTEEGYITFDGVGADLVSWFDQGKVLASNWNDLSTLVVGNFSAVGDPPSRRFAIMLPYSWCENDRLILLAITSQYIDCSFDYHDSYPKFYYATTATWGDPTTGAGTTALTFTTALPTTTPS